MMARFLVPIARAAVLGVALLAASNAAHAQQQPSPAALASARELMELKGIQNLVAPVVVGVIEQTKGGILQTNPGLSKDLDEVSVQLRGEYQQRTAEMTNEVVKLYAQRFSEQELKEAVAFYKSPTGKKLLVEEPKILDETYARLQQWATRLQDEVMIRVRAEMKKRGHNL
ncbi:MAG TPA: DUF2059 domain-containing protein [Xanthobacteraceae bacterium]|nr:DUF2059 domain-containing protein [Xanthobacteraceae bacterium]